MNRPEELRDLLGDEVPEAELARLQRVHELLVRAGPPPELPERLASPPVEEGARLHPFPRRRARVAVLLAAALAAATFGFGYLAAALGQGGSGFHTQFALPMRGTAAAEAASASIDVGAKDKDGNWPLLLKVRGLSGLGPGGYYELYLTKKGRLGASCGTFTVHGGTTTVRLNAPYDLKSFDGWVVMAHRLGAPEPASQVLLTT